MKRIRLQKNTIIKFFGATIVFYIFLASNTFHVGDMLIPSQEEYLQQTGVLWSGGDVRDNSLQIDNIISGENTDQTHGAANNSDEQRFNEICQTNEKLCTTMLFVGEYTNKEKNTYLTSLFKIGGFINDTLITKQKLEDTLQQINVSKTSGKRGSANRNTIVLNIGTVIDKSEFFELLCHEIGHILDLGVLQGTAGDKDQNFTEFGRKVFEIDDMSLLFYAVSRESENIRKADSTKKDFCSGYGMSDPFEDFAECLNLYLNHNQLFRLMARKNAIMGKKYNTVARLFNGIYINPKKSDATFVQSNTNRRPRDTTRIVKN